MAFLVRAFPLKRSVAEFQSFLDALNGEKRDDVDRFYREYGVSQEVAYLQDLEDGKKILIVVSVLSDAGEAGARYATASAAFHTWFKEQILRLTGVDPNAFPLGPPTEQVFAWQAH